MTQQKKGSRKAPRTHSVLRHKDGSYASTTDESFRKFFVGDSELIQSGMTAQAAHSLVKKMSGKAPRKHNPNWADNTINARSDKRKSELQAAAELNGFEKWSTMMTYIKNEALAGRAVVSNGNA